MGIEIVMAMIVIVALLGNGLVIYVFLVRRKSFLKKPYSIFILNLAVVDCITAIFLTFSRFLYLPPVPTHTETAATAYCILIWAPWMPFTLGYISIYTCLVLTFERWFAAVKPQTYRMFKFRHAIFAVVFVWLWGAVVNVTTLFRINYTPAEKEQCQWIPLPVANTKLLWVDFALQSLIPMFAMVVLYAHIYYTLKKLPNLTRGREEQLKKVTLVALAACSAIIVGWMPGRITIMLAKYGILSVGGKIHTTCVTFTFLNSCINPFLYGICSPRFRQEYRLVFGKLLACCKKPSGRVSLVPNANEYAERGM